MAKPCPWLVRAAAARARDEVCWSRGVVSVAIAAIVVTVSVLSAMMAAANAVVYTEKLDEDTHHNLL